MPAWPICLTPAGAGPARRPGGLVHQRTDVAGDHVHHAPLALELPSTTSRAWRRTTPRSRAQVSGQSVTLTIPRLVLQGEEDRAPRGHRMLAGDDQAADPHRSRRTFRQGGVVTAPSRSSAGRNNSTTWRRASSEMTA